MNLNKIKQLKRNRRHARVRAKVSGTADIPRLSVFRSLKTISAQLIDDTKGITLVSASEKELLQKSKSTDQPRKVALAKQIGQKLATKALEKKITACVFDKGHYLYHGRVKALAEGAREGGLKF